MLQLPNNVRTAVPHFLRSTKHNPLQAGTMVFAKMIAKPGTLNTVFIEQISLTGGQVRTYERHGDTKKNTMAYTQR